MRNSTLPKIMDIIYAHSIIMYMYCLQDQGSKELFGGAMTDSEEEGIWGRLQIDYVVILACSVL